MVSKVQPQGLDFDDTGAAGAAKGDLSNTTALGVPLKAPLGTADCYGAIMSAADRLNGRPGRIVLPQGKALYLRTPIELPDGVVLYGWATIGTRAMENVNVFGAQLWVDEDVEILCGNGAGAINVAVMRAGLAVGQTSAQRYATWNGTAFLLKENTAGHVFRGGAIVGFNQGIRSENITANINVDDITNNRLTVDGVLMNNINEIHLHNSADTSRLGAHMWPAAQYQAEAEPDNAHIKSTGTGVRLTGLNDHTEIRAFAYGKARGFHITDGANVDLTGSSADYPPGSVDGSIGFLVDGAAQGVLVNSVRASGMDYGIEINSTATDAVAAMIVGSSTWGLTRGGIRSMRGDVLVVGGALREDGNVAEGVTTGPNSGVTTIIGTDIRGFSTAISNHSSSTVTRHINCTFSNNTVNINNPYVPTVASAAGIVLNGIDLAYTVTGSATIGDVSNAASYAGKRVTLRFAGNAVVVESGNVKLAGNVAFNAQADATLTIESNGNNWSEVGRSLPNEWVSFTPALSATSGTLTTAAATGKYRRDGSLVTLVIKASITTNGTATGGLLATMPTPVAAGIEAVGNGKMVSGGDQTLSAVAGPLSNQMTIVDDDGAYPGADSRVLVVTICYQPQY